MSDILERLRLRQSRIVDGTMHTCGDTCTHPDCLAVASLREIERLRGLLQEARDSVRKHWRGHVKGLERAIRLDRIDVIAIETKREAELRDLRDRIDCALGTANQPKESK